MGTNDGFRARALQVKHILDTRVDMTKPSAKDVSDWIEAHPEMDTTPPPPPPPPPPPEGYGKLCEYAKVEPPHLDPILQDLQASCLQTEDSTVHSAPQSQTDPVNSSPHAAVGLTKDYKCNINIAFPETEIEKKHILTKIESVIKSVTGSVIDLDFLRAKVLDVHEEEIMLMDFADLATVDLQTLPWSKIEFKAQNLGKGSTILDFRMEFKEPPRNYEDANVYRLMELFILSAVENIQFIQSVEPLCTDYANKHEVLSLRLHADNTEFDQELLQKLMNHVRGIIKLTVGDDEHDSDLSDDNVENVLKDLAAKISERDGGIGLFELTPISLRKLVKSSQIFEKDMVKITFEIENKADQNKSVKVAESSSTQWLFPFDFRKLTDLNQEDVGKIKLTLTEDLPQASNVWFRFSTKLYPTLSTSEIESLQREALGVPSPYLTILEKYSDNGGTLGGLLTAMEELKQTRDISQEDTERIDEYIGKVEEIREKSFEAILDKVYCPSASPHIRSLQEFEEMHDKHQQKLKTNVLERFEDMKDSLKPGDQLWTFRKPQWMRSYAHVVIVAEEETFIHVAAPVLKPRFVEAHLRTLQRRICASWCALRFRRGQDQQSSDKEPRCASESVWTMTLPPRTARPLQMECWEGGLPVTRQVINC